MNNKSTDPKAHIECLDKRESSSEKGKVVEKYKTIIEPGSQNGCRRKKTFTWSQLPGLVLSKKKPWFPGWL